VSRQAAATRQDVRSFGFVLEQTLGNRVHGRNLEAVLAADATVVPSVLRLAPEDGWRSRTPVLGNWTVQAGLRARSWLAQVQRDGPLDALYVHSSVPATLLTDVMRRLPTVVSTDATPRNIDSVGASYGHQVLPWPLERVKAGVTAAAYRAAVAVVAQSRWTAASLVQDYGVAPDAVHVLRQGADLRAFAPRGDREPGRSEVRLLFVGGDFVRKGGPTLLEAVRHVPGVRLDLVTGQDVDGLPPGVHVHRGLDHCSGELFRLFAQADVFVLPTTGDAAPLVLGEALAAGLPIVATPVGAVPEMVVDGVTGLLVRPGRVDDLVQALRTLVADAGLRRRLGAQALALASREHDAERNGRAVLDLLREVVPARGARGAS
jgi:glycosyltransferase involved in cell wall biosynthesis